MRTFTVSAKKTERCRIVCRSRALGVLRKEVGERRAFVFTDENVLRLYGHAVRDALPAASLYAMPAGEANKTPRTLFGLLQKMAEAGLHRNSVLVALGGGVVGDIGGLAASLYMRGISCIQIPTTLLSQTDSSVGGKTAIDFCGVKNLLGAFHQPELVLVDNAFLETLPHRELRCGLGEIVKHGALNAGLFGRLTQQENLFDLGFLGSIVPENIAVKADIVRRDPTETGLRRCLNLGHTTAHAFELGGSSLSHGECVLWGLIFESRIAARHFGADGKFTGQLETLCKRVLGEGEVPSAEGARLALLDKKNTAADRVTLTLPVAAGKYEIAEMPFSQYEAELNEIRKELC